MKTSYANVYKYREIIEDVLDPWTEKMAYMPYEIFNEKRL